MKDLINRESNRAGVNGERLGAICKHTMVSKQMVSRWIKAYVQQQHTEFKPREASPIKQTYLVQILQSHRLGLSYETIHRSIPRVSAMTLRQWMIVSEQCISVNKMEIMKRTELMPGKGQSINLCYRSC